MLEVSEKFDTKKVSFFGNDSVFLVVAGSSRVSYDLETGCILHAICWCFVGDYVGGSWDCKLSLVDDIFLDEGKIVGGGGHDYFMHERYDRGFYFYQKALIFVDGVEEALSWGGREVDIEAIGVNDESNSYDKSHQVRLL